MVASMKEYISIRLLPLEEPARLNRSLSLALYMREREWGRGRNGEAKNTHAYIYIYIPDVKLVAKRMIPVVVKYE
jgi:hypothetical protein